MAQRVLQLLLISSAFIFTLAYICFATNALEPSQFPPSTHFELSREGLTRVLAIGDLHGDYNALQKILEFAKADPQTTVVHTGDTIDRGDDTIKLLDFFMAAPSNYRHLMGNHELMNIANNLNYVSPGDFDSFGGVDKRVEAFAKGGKYGAYLRTLDPVVQIGDVVFVHGGVSAGVANQYRSVADISAKMRQQIAEDKFQVGPN
mmetsp:Transcript_23599/g.41828  ORF Transcript_23599/g.41828 Transcript_23599/m.41828 type:complete len:204 (+) Transcript_23599:1477-2088(+)